VLVGNPNVGKSVLFGALTGRRVTVSNYPGTTVEVTRGRLRDEAREVEVVDSPGTNSLVPLSEDERVTCRLVAAARGEAGAVVVQVADAKNLRRALLLTLELGQLGVPVVLALNMADEAAEQGIRIDTLGLARTLGIPVVLTTATRGEGIEALLEAARDARPPRGPLPATARQDLLELVRAADNGGAPAEDLLRHHEALMEAAGDLVERHTGDAKAATSKTRQAASALARRLGAIAVHPVWGWPVLGGVLYVLYLFVGVLGAGTLVDLLETRLFGGVLNPAATRLFDLVPWAFARDLFVGKYGVVTVGVTYGVAIILPIVTTFFIAFGILEDSGYLPRLAVMMDRLFRAIGLNGKAVLPMVLGLGCDTMATMTARILPSRKERVVATLLLALGVPCSAQLGVLLAMMGTVPLWGGIAWGAAVGGVLAAVGWLAARVLPGEITPFVVELPPIRWPRPGNVLSKTVSRIEWYLREAVPLFILGTLVLFALDRVGALPGLVHLGEPIVVGILGLPAEASEALLVGFLRRDFAATRLFDMSRTSGLSPVQVVVSMVTITLFIPCVANVFMIAKERGIRTALGIVALVFPLAIAGGGLVRLVLVALGLGAAQ